LSAATGDGVAAWLAMVGAADAGVPVAARGLDVDYERYGRAEARLGWLNAQGSLQAGRGAHAQEWADGFLETLVKGLDGGALPVAHVKLHVDGHQAAALKGSAIGPAPSRLTWDYRAPVLAAQGARWVLNARVDAAPEVLRGIVHEALRQTYAGVRAAVETTECFQPAPPRPAHRIVALADGPS
jgi:hypothetical protein